MAEIKKIVEQALDNKQNKAIKVKLGLVRKSISKKVFEKTGLNVSDYSFVIDNFAILHTIKKHGNAKQENKRGQIAVTTDFFELIPKVLKNPDTIIDAGKNKIGRRVIIFEKQIGNNIVYVQECRNNKKELAMQTMYIKKAT